MSRKIYIIDGVEVTQEEYLYGKGTKVPKIPPGVIIKRVKLLNKQLSLVLQCDYHTRDEVREAELIKAIDFWENINTTN